MIVYTEAKQSMKETVIKIDVSELVDGLTELMDEKVVAFKQYTINNTLMGDSCFYGDFRVVKVGKDSFNISNGQSFVVIHFDKVEKILIDQKDIGIYFKGLAFMNLTFKSSQYFKYFV